MGIFTLSTSVKVELLLIKKEWVKIRVITGVYDGGFLINDSEKIEELIMRVGEEYTLK